jgi:hypothetical protein
MVPRCLLRDVWGGKAGPPKKREDRNTRPRNDGAGPVLRPSSSRGSGSGAAAGGSIFLCLNGQGGRWKSGVAKTFGPDGDDGADRGAWMSI